MDWTNGRSETRFGFSIGFNVFKGLDRVRANTRTNRPVRIGLGLIKGLLVVFIGSDRLKKESCMVFQRVGSGS